MSINQVTITGNLTREPEVRLTNGGMQVMNFGIAVNDRVRNQQTGQWDDRANFIDCALFGQRAASLANILHKGFKCAIQGRLRQSTWEDKQTGQRRSKLEVVVNEIDFMQPKGAGLGGYQTEAQPTPQQSQSYQPSPQPSYQQDRIVGADDIPF